MVEEEEEDICEEKEEVWAVWISPVYFFRVYFLLIPSKSFGVFSGCPFRLIYFREMKAS